MAAEVYPHADRARVRQAVRHLESLEEEARNCLERGVVMQDGYKEQILRVTETTDPARQIVALQAYRDQLRDQHLERLYPLAPNEFNAFCEVMIPDEPPESKWHVFLTDTLQSIEADPSKGRFILNCPPGHAKPLSVETLVRMADGGCKRLGDIEVGDRVLSGEARARKVTAVHEQGELDLYELRTKAGRVIHTAGDHSFRVGLGWKPALDLRPGDRLDVVGTPFVPPLTAPVPEAARTTSAAFAELCAWWCAYGTVGLSKLGSGKLSINPQMWVPARAAEGLRQVLAANDRKASIHPVRGVTPGFAARLAPSLHADLIGPLGLDRKAEERRVPAWLFTAALEDRLAFLSRYITERAELPMRFPRPRLVLYMRSALFAQDLQRLLAGLGVPAEVVYPLEGFGGRPSVEIGRHGIAAAKASGLVLDVLARNGSDRLADIAPAEIETDHVFRDEVVSLTPYRPGPCRCLTVEVDHSFTANGVVVHNSTYASRLYVVWRMGRNPNLQVIGGGHGQTFVENEFSYKNRSLLLTPEYKRIFPGVLVDPKKNAKGQWALAGHKGQYVAKGVGQGVHGFRANFVVVDDPYAKVEDAESPTQREKVRTWFLTDLATRLLPGGKVFVIMTRFHEDDLTGTLLELNKQYTDDKKYYHVAAPAICFDPETDPLNRQLGEVLWDFYPMSEFVDKRIGQKFSRFALIYQQDDAASSEDSVSGLFQYYQIRPDRTDAALRIARDEGSVNAETGRVIPQTRVYFRRIVVSVDTATKDNERADWTVVQVWGQTHDGKHYLLDQKRQKVEFNDLITLIERTARQHQADYILVEDKGNGTSYQQARAPTNGKRLAPAPLVMIKTPANQGKAFRFDEITPLIEQGEVYLPEWADYTELFVREVAQFPEGNNDDQVDAMTQYLRWAKGQRRRLGSKKVGSMG